MLAPNKNVSSNINSKQTTSLPAAARPPAFPVVAAASKFYIDTDKSNK